LRSNAVVFGLNRATFPGRRSKNFPNDGFECFVPAKLFSAEKPPAEKARARDAKEREREGLPL
jgi:hypothetical protein